MNPRAHGFRRGSLYVCLFILAVPGLALAQAPDSAAADSAHALPAIEVVVSILQRMGPAIGSAASAQMTAIPGSALRAWQPRMLTDALARQAGVSVYDDLGSPFKTTLVTRGFAASPVVGLPQGVSVFLDGVPVNEPDARQVNFDLLPLDHVERTELLSGTASLLGPNSLGGAINLMTRRGTIEDRAELELSGGSFDSYSADGSVSGRLGGWNFYAGGGYAEEGGWREFTSADRANVLLNIGRYRADRGIRVQGLFAQSYAETAGSLPLRVYQVTPRTNLTSGDFEDLRQVHLAVSGHLPVSGGQGAFTVYARGHDAERFNVNQASDPDVRSLSENRTLGLSADWRGVARGGRGALGYRLGVSGATSSTDIRIFAVRIDPGMTTHVRSPISEAAGFGVLEYALGRMAVSASLRADAVHIPFRNQLDSTRDTTSLYVQLNPRAGLSWDAGRGMSAFASVGRSFRAPAVIELACADPENPCPLPFALGDDPPLDPVTAVTWEIGGRWTAATASVSAAAYRTDVRDDIFLFPYHDDSEPAGSTIDGYFANIEATRRVGVELDARASFGDRISAYATYTHTRATFQASGIELFSIREEAGSGENEIEKGDRIPLVPAHAARIGADLELIERLEVGIAGRYTGRRWLRGDEANEEPALDGHIVADARLGYTRGGWGLSAVIENVFDTRYAAFGTFNIHQAAGDVLERFLTPGEPRSVRLLLRRSFEL